MKNIHIQNLIEEGILKAGKALDLGCGAGDASQYLASQGFEVEAVDVSDRSIPGVTFIKSDIRDFNIKENTYDFIHARNILPFLTKNEALDVIDKMHMGLKKNGVMFFTLFGIEDAWNGVKNNMSFFSDSEIDELIKKLPVFHRTIKIGQGKALDGKWKKWHIYSFVCVKDDIR